RVSREALGFCAEAGNLDLVPPSDHLEGVRGARAGSRRGRQPRSQRVVHSRHCDGQAQGGDQRGRRLMADLRQRRQKFYAAFGILLALDLACLVFLFSPWGSGKDRIEVERDQLRRENHDKKVEFQRYEGMGGKLKKADSVSAEILHSRIPEKDSDISSALARI